MKKIKIILSIIIPWVMLSGCFEEAHEVENWSDWISRETFDISRYGVPEFPDVNTFRGRKDVENWVRWSILYSKDEDAQNILDYWQTSSETLSLGHGDCEDRSILMYVIMLNNNFPEDQMDLMILHCENNGKNHCVLVIYGEGYSNIWNLGEFEILSAEPMESTNQYEITAIFNKDEFYYN